MSTERFDTVVIGGGQAGLAVGYYLRRSRADFIIVDAGERIGQSWDSRWDSMRLFSPAHFTRLPGRRFPGPRRHLPSKNEMADYLRSYAAQFELPVRLRWRVDQLSRDADGRFVVSSAGRVLLADTVVVATGPAMSPRLPDVAGELDPDIQSLHAVEYRNPEQLRDGTVLIVGAGNSGAEIALDVAPTHEVVLAGRDTGRLPISLGGPVYRVMNQFLTANTRLGRRFAASVNTGKGTPLVRVRPSDLTKVGVVRAPRVVGHVDGRPRLDDGQVLDVANVIWCTGYRPDYSWIALARFPRDRLPTHQRGAVLEHPGLYVLGLPFLFRMASSLVGGVGPDARHVARLIAKDLRRAPSARKDVDSGAAESSDLRGH
jgi:putative flavoprotein involved in K+ transport